MSSGMLCDGFQDEFGTNLGFSRIQTFMGKGCRKPPPLSSPWPLVAPLGATDALVAVDRHDRPAEPSSGFLEGLSTDQQSVKQ